MSVLAAHARLEDAIHQIEIAKKEAVAEKPELSELFNVVADICNLALDACNMAREFLNEQQEAEP